MQIDVNSDELHRFVSQLLNEALAEVNVTTFKELVKVSGLNSTLNTLRPYTKQLGYIILNLVKENMDVKGDGLDAAFIPFLFIQSTIKTDVTGEIKEGGAVGIVHDCCYHKANASPEFCVAMSHYGSNAVCEVVNPDLECIWTHHLTDGDPYCRYVMRKKSDSNRDLENLGRSLITVPRIELSRIYDTDVEKYSMMGWWVWLTQSFVDLNGSEKTLEILRPNIGRIGSSVGSSLVQKYPDLKDSLEAVGQLINMWEGTMFGRIGNVEYVTNDAFARIVTMCPMTVYPNEICKQNEAFYQGICEAISPDNRFSYDRMMTRGDKTCHWTIRKKGEVAKEKPKEEATSDDPAKILALRYARGELSEVEFDKKMAHLRKHGVVK